MKSEEAARLATSVVVYWTIALLTVLVATVGYGQESSVRAIFDPCLWGGFALAMALILRPAHDWLLPAVWVVAGVLLTALALAGIPFGAQYGDADFLRATSLSGLAMPRGLAPSAIASWVHAAFTSARAPTASLQSTLAPADYTVSVLSTLAFTVGTVLLLWQWPRRLSVLLPTLSPLWFLFATGYVEIYPFVAPLMIFALVWIFERPLEERSPYQVGILAAVLCPLAQFAFLPFVLFLILAYAVAAPRRLLGTLLIAVGLAVAGIWIFWPEGVADYFTSLSALPKGTAKILHDAYRGHGSEWSSLFKISYLTNAVHLRDWGFMWFFGGGLVAALLLAFGVVLSAAERSREPWKPLFRDPRFGLGVALVGTYVLYSFTMMPRLGPNQEIDLFYNAFMMAAFFAGLAFDSLTEPPPTLRPLVIVVVLANSSALARFVIFQTLANP